VDELDKAIYRYYEHYKNLAASSSNDKKYSAIGRIIGKGHDRVRKAIDRFEFKRDNADFAKRIEKEYNPTNKRYSNVNSSIYATGPFTHSRVPKVY